MKTFKSLLFLLPVVAIGVLLGCSSSPSKSADVSDNLRKSLDQSGLKEVAVSQDREKGVITLGGHTKSETDKFQAENIAKSIASGQVIANQIAVVPSGVESEAKAINSDLDKGIEKNLDAALIEARLHDGVKYSVKNHVVTLTGDVNSQAKRTQAETVAARVPSVQQVVNELQVKAQKATSSN
jgi:hyperosmotically inducible protein